MKSKAEIRREAKLRRDRSRKRFLRAKRIQEMYQRGLLSIANHVGKLVEVYTRKGEVVNETELTMLLHNYAAALDPYAKLLARQMLNAADAHNYRSWKEAGTEMGQLLQRELKNTPVAKVYEALMGLQVDLIKSIPKEAAERVHTLVTRSLSAGNTRADEIATDIERTAHVTRSRAMLIARTETSRASTVFTQARAEQLGSTQYIWRTAHDGDVRPSHKQMEGKVVSWDNPPTLDNMTGHAGALPNCRCWPEPILPDIIE